MATRGLHLDFRRAAYTYGLASRQWLGPEQRPSRQSGVTNVQWLDLCRGGPDVGTMRSTPLRKPLHSRLPRIRREVEACSALPVWKGGQISGRAACGSG